MKKLLICALLLTAIGAKAQTVNEALIRQQINAVLTTNANKAITGAAQKNLMNLMVTYIKSADSVDRANNPASVRSTTLTGLSTASSSAITSGSTVLQGLGQLQGQVNEKASLASPVFSGVIKLGTGSILGGGKIVIANNYTATTSNEHGFDDNSVFTSATGKAYNSFDARGQIAGDSVNHYNGFQFDATSAASVMDEMNGSAMVGRFSGGTLKEYRSYYVEDVTGTGTVLRNYGIRIRPILRGTQLNYAIYAEGSAPVVFTGMKFDVLAADRIISNMDASRSLIFAGGTGTGDGAFIRAYGGQSGAAGQIQYITLNSKPHQFLGGNMGIGNAATAAPQKLTVDGNISLMTAGNKLLIATGTNASAGTATLVAGTVTVSTTAVTASSIIQITSQSGATVASYRVSARTAGVSFTITSSDSGDTNAVGWIIIN